MEFKVCKLCGKQYPATSEFFCKQKSKCGLRPRCKICEYAIMKEYRSRPEQKEKNRIMMKKWRDNNPEKNKLIVARCREKNRESYNELRRLRYHTDEEYRRRKDLGDKLYRGSVKGLAMLHKEEYMEKARLRNKKFRQENAEAIKSYNDKYRKENKEFLMGLWRKNREELKPSYIATTMRLRVDDLTPEIIETKQLIIKLKRELKSTNLK